MIYLDYAATTPLRKEALDVWVQAQNRFFGNPSSLHDLGTEAKAALELCREQFAEMIGGEKEGVYFTSGGSEASILAIKSLVDAHRERGNHLITTAVEHSSVYNLFQQLEEEGFDVTYLPVDSRGRISLDQLKEAIRSNTVLASIHHGNPEIGALQPIAKIGKILRKHDVIFHTDSVQTFGEVPIDVKDYGIDSLSVSSHKIYGPKGIGLCYMNPEIAWKAQLKQTTHEGGFRPGTVDVPSILAFTEAAQLATRDMPKRQKKYQELRRRFVDLLKEMGREVQVEGDPLLQLPHIIGLSFSRVEGQYIMLECNRNGIAISTGTACQVGMQTPSRTMLVMGKSEEEAKQFVRISFGKATTEAEIDQATQVLKEIVHTLPKARVER